MMPALLLRVTQTESWPITWGWYCDRSLQHVSTPSAPRLAFPSFVVCNLCVVENCYISCNPPWLLGGFISSYSRTLFLLLFVFFFFFVRYVFVRCERSRVLLCVFRGWREPVFGVICCVVFVCCDVIRYVHNFFLKINYRAVQQNRLTLTLAWGDSSP